MELLGSRALIFCVVFFANLAAHAATPDEAAPDESTPTTTNSAATKPSRPLRSYQRLLRNRLFSDKPPGELDPEFWSNPEGFFTFSERVPNYNWRDVLNDRPGPATYQRTQIQLSPQDQATLLARAKEGADYRAEAAAKYVREEYLKGGTQYCREGFGKAYAEFRDALTKFKLTAQMIPSDIDRNLKAQEEQARIQQYIALHDPSGVISANTLSPAYSALYRAGMAEIQTQTVKTSTFKPEHDFAEAKKLLLDAVNRFEGQVADFFVSRVMKLSTTELKEGAYYAFTRKVSPYQLLAQPGFFPLHSVFHPGNPFWIEPAAMTNLSAADFHSKYHMGENNGAKKENYWRYEFECETDLKLLRGLETFRQGIEGVKDRHQIFRLRALASTALTDTAPETLSAHLSDSLVFSKPANTEIERIFNDFKWSGFKRDPDFWKMDPKAKSYLSWDKERLERQRFKFNREVADVVHQGSFFGSILTTAVAGAAMVVQSGVLDYKPSYESRPPHVMTVEEQRASDAALEARLKKYREEHKDNPAFQEKPAVAPKDPAKDFVGPPAPPRIVSPEEMQAAVAWLAKDREAHKNDTPAQEKKSELAPPPAPGEDALKRDERDLEKARKEIEAASIAAKEFVGPLAPVEAPKPADDFVGPPAPPLVIAPEKLPAAREEVAAESKVVEAEHKAAEVARKETELVVPPAPEKIVEEMGPPVPKPILPEVPAPQDERKVSQDTPKDDKDAPTPDTPGPHHPGNDDNVLALGNDSRRPVNMNFAQGDDSGEEEKGSRQEKKNIYFDLHISHRAPLPPFFTMGSAEIPATEMRPYDFSHVDVAAATDYQLIPNAKLLAKNRDLIPVPTPYFYDQFSGAELQSVDVRNGADESHVAGVKILYDPISRAYFIDNREGKLPANILVNARFLNADYASPTFKREQHRQIELQRKAPIAAEMANLNHAQMTEVAQKLRQAGFTVLGDELDRELRLHPHFSYADYNHLISEESFYSKFKEVSIDPLRIDPDNPLTDMIGFILDGRLCAVCNGGPHVVKRTMSIYKGPRKGGWRPIVISGFVPAPAGNLNTDFLHATSAIISETEGTEHDQPVLIAHEEATPYMDDPRVKKKITAGGDKESEPDLEAIREQERKQEERRKHFEELRLRDAPPPQPPRPDTDPVPEKLAPIKPEPLKHDHSDYTYYWEFEEGPKKDQPAEVRPKEDKPKDETDFGEEPTAPWPEEGHRRGITVEFVTKGRDKKNSAEEKETKPNVVAERKPAEPMGPPAPVEPMGPPAPVEPMGPPAPVEPMGPPAPPQIAEAEHTAPVPVPPIESLPANVVAPVSVPTEAVPVQTLTLAPTPPAPVPWYEQSPGDLWRQYFTAGDPPRNSTPFKDPAGLPPETRPGLVTTRRGRWSPFIPGSDPPHEKEIGETPPEEKEAAPAKKKEVAQQAATDEPTRAEIAAEAASPAKFTPLKKSAPPPEPVFDPTLITAADLEAWRNEWRAKLSRESDTVKKLLDAHPEFAKRIGGNYTNELQSFALLQMSRLRRLANGGEFAEFFDSAPGEGTLDEHNARSLARMTALSDETQTAYGEYLDAYVASRGRDNFRARLTPKWRTYPFGEGYEVVSRLFAETHDLMKAAMADLSRRVGGDRSRAYAERVDRHKDPKSIPVPTHADRIKSGLRQCAGWLGFGKNANSPK